MTLIRQSPGKAWNEKAKTRLGSRMGVGLMLRILCLCRLAGRRANRESRLIPPRVGNITRISFIAHLPCVEGAYESVPVIGRFLQNEVAQASCRSVSCAPVDTAARIVIQTPPREPKGSVPWRGRFLCASSPLPACAGFNHIFRERW